jgi:hypothetical protein
LRLDVIVPRGLTMRNSKVALLGGRVSFTS